MAYFKNDYSVLAHERILNALVNAKNEVNVPYGNDIHSFNAANKIKEIFNVKDGNVYFLSGGTQANMVVISYFLKPYEGVISCDSGHINVHETAAVEGAGHKFFTVKNEDGKLTAKAVLEALKLNNDSHMVKLKMVYISNSTEIGTIYSKQELLELRKVCDDNNLYLFIDGARLGAALTSKYNDVECSLLGEICDAFYVGGTKNGLLSGEAVVIKNSKLNKYFNYHIKNKGALLAKGFVLGIQFEEVFKDSLYFDLAKNANEMANFIKEELEKIGVSFAYTPVSNQLFVEFKKELANKLIEKYGCEIWEDKNETIIIRFVTSWATKKEECLELINDLKEWFNK